MYDEILNEYSPEEIAESLIFSGPKNKKERETILSEFCDFRKKKVKGQTQKSQTISQLLQLRFLMEAYLDTTSSNKP
ncbi:MAG: hypothetical protein KGM98_15115 [Bacteroidota bacterium]|nr:hypothetical protein [Bacteroidota bacterium]